MGQFYTDGLTESRYVSDVLSRNLSSLSHHHTYRTFLFKNPVPRDIFKQTLKTDFSEGNGFINLESTATRLEVNKLIT